MVDVDFTEIIAANRDTPLITPDGKPTQVFAEWLEAITQQATRPVIYGTGSPEGAVQGIPRQRYVQTDASVGQREWIKQTGIGDTGWLQL